jgi:hypothetical protein
VDVDGVLARFHVLDMDCETHISGILFREKGLPAQGTFTLGLESGDRPQLLACLLAFLLKGRGGFSCRFAGRLVRRLLTGTKERNNGDTRQRHTVSVGHILTSSYETTLSLLPTDRNTRVCGDSGASMAETLRCHRPYVVLGGSLLLA